MNPLKSWIIKGAGILLLLVLALGLAVPASAQVRSAALNDPSEPGSVIVFPKFVKSGPAGFVLVDGVQRPQTEIEVGVVCPRTATCEPHEKVYISFYWVSPPSAKFPAGLCPFVDFWVTTSVGEKIKFNPDGSKIDSDVVGPGLPANQVPAAPENAGYLIGSMVNATRLPIKFDGLIGDAVIRPSSTAVAEYGAIPIQADPKLATGAPLTLDAGNPLAPGLVFDGGPGHYLAVAGAVQGDVKYDNPMGKPGTSFKSRTTLTLLTLDVSANIPNAATAVPFSFFNETSQRPVPASTAFFCWEEVQLSRGPNGIASDKCGLNCGFTQAGMGSEKGLFVSGQATQPGGGSRTLLGLVETDEGSSTGTGVPARSYIGPLTNNSEPISTTFMQGPPLP